MHPEHTMTPGPGIKAIKQTQSYTEVAQSFTEQNLRRYAQTSYEAMSQPPHRHREAPASFLCETLRHLCANLCLLDCSPNAQQNHEQAQDRMTRHGQPTPGSQPAQSRTLH